ncbi:DUF4397 domain-containing protein [Hymenobacter lapidiphilus]|uniref:DUF4397 domain-containing protein n=1 Tax=Hymenobacter sp. CCM 8763 TaxID=2303334 RepID=UPI000E357622|nr:DUF4397 domain-containing protein [Hymenobacter sp. CCM 8763]RFP67030.1 DUF4397 domain-containing protein [Hymenobacter sp. CCM 8763]
MNLFSSIRPVALLAALPAMLAFSACGDDDKDPAPQQGRVLLVHAAAATPGQVTAFVNDNQVGQLNYGQNSAYLAVNSGSPTFRINNGTQEVTTKKLDIAANQNYSVFAYSPTATIGSADLISFQDDLTAPVAGQAKIRLVHLATGAPSPVRLSVPALVVGTAPTDLTPDVAFGTASAFVSVNAGTAPTLTVTTTGTPRTTLLTVGDGSGSGTGTKTLEAGKIYTVLVRGIANPGAAAAQQPKAAIIANN